MNLEANHFSYTLGQATIDNDKAEQFLAEISQQLPERVRLTVYDQGYSAISKPLNDILRTAMIITGISIIAVVVFIALFGFLFVYRQRDTADTMLRLGACRPNVFTYSLFGSGMVALSASVAGSAIGKTFPVLLSSWSIKLFPNTRQTIIDFPTAICP